MKNGTGRCVCNGVSTLARKLRGGGRGAVDRGPRTVDLVPGRSVGTAGHRQGLVRESEKLPVDGRGMHWRSGTAYPGGSSRSNQAAF